MVAWSSSWAHVCRPAFWFFPPPEAGAMDEESEVQDEGVVSLAAECAKLWPGMLLKSSEEEGRLKDEKEVTEGHSG